MAYNYLDRFVNQLQSHGRYSFTIHEVEEGFPREKPALHMALKRLMDKRRLVRVRNGFYVIVPAEYAGQGMLPALWFVDALMSFLKKPYYVSLLSAAALHGASHQQPQWLQVMTEKPPIRPIEVKGIGIRFIAKKMLPEKGIIQKKTETGYVNVSSPLMTGLDLIQFERHAGGFFRVIEVLDELAETFKEKDVKAVLENEFPISVLQRFGYLCDDPLNCPEIARFIHQHLLHVKVHPVVLSPSGSDRAGKIDKKWQVIQNINLENID